MDMSVIHKGRENSITNPMNSSTNDFQFTASFASSNILTKPSALYYYKTDSRHHIISSKIFKYL